MLYEVITELVALFSKHSKNTEELEQKLANAFSTASTSPNYNKTPTNISIRIPLGSDSKTIT